MKKKWFALLLALSMTLGLAACGGKTPPAPSADPSAAVEDNTPAPVEANYNVVLVVPNSLGDKAFSDMVWDGVQMAKEQNPQINNIKCIELQGDTTTPLPTLTELAESGEWDLIVTGTASLMETIMSVADSFPEQQFIYYDSELDYSNGAFPNVASFSALQNEGSFLGGALAAMMSETGVIGFVGGKETSSVSDFLVGYIEGAAYINPDIVVRPSFVGSFIDSPKAKELALTQNAQKADVIYAVAGGAGSGVYEAAAEAGFWALGVDSDQSLKLEESNPEVANAILTSVVKHFDIVLCNAITDALQGNLAWGSHNAINMAADGVGLAENSYYEKAVPADVRAKVEELREKVVNGEITVSTAIGMDAQVYEDLKNSVS